MNADNENEYRETFSDKEIYERFDIPGTPFTAIKVKEGVNFAIMGRFRITENMDTMPEVIEKVEKPTWEIIMKILGAVITGGIKAEVEDALRERGIDAQGVLRETAQ